MRKDDAGNGREGAGFEWRGGGTEILIDTEHVAPRDVAFEAKGVLRPNDTAEWKGEAVERAPMLPQKNAGLHCLKGKVTN